MITFLILSNACLALLLCLSVHQMLISQRNAAKAIQAAKEAQDGWERSIESTNDCLKLLGVYK